MCRLLTRFFTCLVNNVDTEHSYQYLERCANPEYVSCIAAGALSHFSEWYEETCHECTGGFIQPANPPVRNQRSNVDETSAAARQAAISYFKSLCDVLETSLYGMIRRDDPEENALPPDQTRFMMETAEKELACRFDKSHFSNGPYCDCCETNKEPELHNVSAAIRQIIARANFFSEDDYMCVKRDLEQAQYPAVRASMMGGYNITRETLARQPDLSVLDTFRQPSTVEKTRVLPIAFENWDHRKRLDVLMKHHDAVLSSRYGGVQGWKTKVKAAVESAPIAFEIDVDKNWEHRHKLIRIILRLLSVDNGLTLERCLSIADLAFGLLSLGELPRHTAQNLAPAVFDLLVSAKLLVLQEDFSQLDTIAVGQILLVEERWVAMTHLLLRNRMFRASDELVRAQMISRTYEFLTAEEIEEHRSQGGKKECPLCEKEMTGPGDGHAFVKVHCSKPHLYGRNCWQRFWSLRYIEGMTLKEGITCLVCNDRVGDWRYSLGRMELSGFELAQAPLESLQQFQRNLTGDIFGNPEAE